MRKERWTWSVANGIGLGVGFLAYLQVGMVLRHGLDFERYWVPGEEPVGTEFLVQLMVALLVAGAVFGAAQALVLRSSGVRAGMWILATALGFLLLIGVYWPLLVARVLGDIPGPVEPLLFTAGGSTLAGICQFVALRRQGVSAGRWLGLWIAGVIAGIVVVNLIFMSLGAAITSWPLQIFFAGFLIAGVAALVSGGALFDALGPDKKTPAMRAGVVLVNGSRTYFGIASTGSSNAMKRTHSSSEVQTALWGSSAGP